VVKSRLGSSGIRDEIQYFVLEFVFDPPRNFDLKAHSGLEQLCPEGTIKCKLAP
jgi:hypothetical protein